MGALYNSFERDLLDAPKCHPQTRVAVINRLIDWLTGKFDDEALIMWLYTAKRVRDQNDPSALMSASQQPKMPTSP